MTAKVFVDSNVLIYSKDIAATRKQEQALNWMEYLWKSRQGRLSFQVLNEFYIAVTTKLRPGLKKEEAREELSDLFAWKPVSTDEVLMRRSWEVHDRYKISFWDSLIVVAAQAQACTYLLSEDLSDGQDFAGTKVINPFHHTPESLRFSMIP